MELLLENNLIIKTPAHSVLPWLWLATFHSDAGDDFQIANGAECAIAGIDMGKKASIGAVHGTQKA